MKTGNIKTKVIKPIIKQITCKYIMYLRYVWRCIQITLTLELKFKKGIKINYQKCTLIKIKVFQNYRINIE